jgi:hypothetical protein
MTYEEAMRELIALTKEMGGSDDDEDGDSSQEEYGIEDFL